MKASELVTFNEDGSITLNSEPRENEGCRHPLKMAINNDFYECGWCHEVIPAEIVLKKVGPI